MRLLVSGVIAIASATACAWAGGGFSQDTQRDARYEQYGFVDLTKDVPFAPQKQDPPAGCKEVTAGIIADGVVNPEDGRPRDIRIEVRKVEGMPALGSEMSAEVRLLNTGTVNLEIPWSTNPQTIEYGPEKWSRQWDVARFGIDLVGATEGRVSLKDLSGYVYGSKYAAGSFLVLPPNGFVDARVRFKLEEEFKFGRLKAGTWMVSASWEQTGRGWGVKDCRASNGYFQYADYYKQEKVGMRLEVAGSQ